MLRVPIIACHSAAQVLCFGCQGGNTCGFPHHCCKGQGTGYFFHVPHSDLHEKLAYCHQPRCMKQQLLPKQTTPLSVSPLGLHPLYNTSPDPVSAAAASIPPAPTDAPTLGPPSVVLPGQPSTSGPDTTHAPSQGRRQGAPEADHATGHITPLEHQLEGQEQGSAFLGLSDTTGQEKRS